MVVEAEALSDIWHFLSVGSIYTFDIRIQSV